VKGVFLLLTLAVVTSQSVISAQAEQPELIFEAGHPSLQHWLLPETPPHPEGNAPTAERIELGRALFFDPRLSGDGTMSCATCHNPEFGWSDGRPTARGFGGEVLDRASPTVVNTAYNGIQMWDGREPTLESQAMGPLLNSAEMNLSMEDMIETITADPAYLEAFAEAYPGQSITPDVVAMAIASFERTVVSNNSRFDQWLRGDADALSEAEVRGFRIFETKGQCSVCHSAPNFTDDGFHNLGLASFGEEDPDLGRYRKVPLGIMKGAFKTPTLRDVALTAPYFHDGSAKTLEEVVEHYVQGGVVKTNLSPNFRPVDLSADEQADLVAFMRALTSPPPRAQLAVNE